MASHKVNPQIVYIKERLAEEEKTVVEISREWKALGEDVKKGYRVRAQEEIKGLLARK
jgi:hypothetical protein